MLPGSVQVRYADWSRALAVRPVGGPGTFGVEMAIEGGEDGPVPISFIAATVKV